MSRTNTTTTTLLITTVLCGCILAASAGGLRTEGFRNLADSTPDTQCSFRGHWDNSTKVCVCNDGYTTHDAPAGIWCNYEQQSQTTAFLLSLFLGYVGGGYWYVKNYLFAALMLSISVVSGCFRSCGLEKDSSGKREVTSPLLYLFHLLLATVVGVWYIVTTIKFGLNDIDDENGVELKSW